MKLSQETTIIAPEKLRDYVVNYSHPDGESKARFLRIMGYEQENWKTLEIDLRTQHPFPVGQNKEVFLAFVFWFPKKNSSTIINIRHVFQIMFPTGMRTTTFPSHKGWTANITSLLLQARSAAAIS